MVTPSVVCRIWLIACGFIACGASYVGVTCVGVTCVSLVGVTCVGVTFVSLVGVTCVGLPVWVSLVCQCREVAAPRHVVYHTYIAMLEGAQILLFSC